MDLTRAVDNILLRPTFIIGDMDMAGAPGHLIWHYSGEKLFDVAAVPKEYRGRAGALLDTVRTPPAP